MPRSSILRGLSGLLAALAVGTIVPLSAVAADTTASGAGNGAEAAEYGRLGLKADELPEDVREMIERHARTLVLRLWRDRIGTVAPDARDAKTALQEWAQARGMQPPAYTLTGRDGPDHQPRFTVEVRLDNGAAETASAGSKRAAEQAAATSLLARMETTND